MLNLSTKWKAAMERSSVPPIYIVRFEPSGPTGKVFSYVTGEEVRFGLSPSVSTVSPIATKVNPYTREWSVGALQLDFKDDGAIRDLLIYRFKGMQVRILFGTDGLDESDFVQRFVGFVDELQPQQGDAISVSLADVGSLLRDQKVVGQWISDHPLSVVTDIYRLAGIGFDRYDAMSHQASVWPNIAHYNLSRYASLNAEDLQDMKALDQGLSAKDAVAELGMLMDASFLPQEDGKVYCKVYNKNAPVVRHWGRDQIRDMKQEKTWDEIHNRVKLEWMKVGDTSKSLELEDRLAQRAYAPFGASAQVYDGDSETEWLWQATRLYTGIAASGETSVTIEYPCIRGFAGANFALGGTFGNATVSGPLGVLWGERPAYFLIDDEIIQFDEFTSYSLRHGVINQGNLSGIWKGTYRIAQRGVLGTTPAIHSARSMVYDVTMPLNMLRNRLDRFAYGIPVISVTVPISEFGVQLLDFVTVEDDVFAHYNVYARGVDATAAWEVIGKEDTHGTDGSHHIKFTLAFVRGLFQKPKSPLININIPNDDKPFTGWKPQATATEVNGLTQHKVSGGTLTNQSGLTATMSQTIVAGDGYYAKKPATEMVYPANSDIWVSWDTFISEWVLDDVANGADKPEMSISQVPMLKIVTDGTSIVSTIDLSGTKEPQTTVGAGAKLIKAHSEYGQSAKVDTTAAVRTTDNSWTTLKEIELEDQYSYIVRANIIGRKLSGGDRFAFTVSAAAYRQGLGAALVGAFETELVRRSDANADAQITVSGNSLLVQVKGQSGHQNYWVADISYHAVSTAEGDDVPQKIHLITNPVSMTGTVETKIGSVRLASGTLNILRALVGCENSVHAATIRLRKQSDGTSLTTVGGTAGVLQEQTTSTMAVATEAWYDVFLVSDNASGVALCSGLYIEYL